MSGKNIKKTTRIFTYFLPIAGFACLGLFLGATDAVEPLSSDVGFSLCYCPWSCISLE